MSDTFLKNLSAAFGFIALAVIFGLLVFVANIEVKDLDLWLHIGMGRHIVQNGFVVPKVDMLSCTIPGNMWINHEWLFQVIVYYIYNAWGPEGLTNMQVILVTVTMLILLFLGYNKNKQLATIFILLLVSLVYHGRFTMRPDLFSLLFFAMYIFVLSYHVDSKWSILTLFIIQLLWTNFHGFFFFGPLFVSIALLAEWLKRNVRLPYEWNDIARLTDDEYKRLKYILGAVILACIINPCTIKGAWYPIGVFFQISGESKIFFDKIVELKKPVTMDTVFSLTHYPFYKLMIVLSFVSFVYNRYRLDVGILIFWLIFLFFSLSAIRNLIFFAFAAYLVFVTNIMNISFEDLVPMEITDRKFFHLTGILVKIFLVIWIMQYGMDLSLNGYYDFDKYERKSEFGGVSLRNYPNKAVDFLVANDVKGNFLNDFNTGAYLVGRCNPNIKVFIDGRTEVYGPEFFKYYQSVWEKKTEGKVAEAVEKYKITGAIMSSVYQPIPKHLLEFFHKNEDWHPVYFDYDGIVYLKDVPLNKAVLEEYKIDFSTWEPKKLDLFRIGSVKVTPYQEINRAYTLESLGYYDLALKETETAVKVSPNLIEVYKLRGKIHGKREEYLKAYENFRIAVIFKTNDMKLRLNLAQSLYDLGEYKFAETQYFKILDRWPNDPKTYFLLSRLYVKQELYEKSMRFLNKGVQMAPKAVKDILKIGDLVFENEEYLKAKEVYELALSSNKQLGSVYMKIGSVYYKLGDKKKAQEAFDKGLKIEPDNKDLIKKIEELKEDK